MYDSVSLRLYTNDTKCIQDYLYRCKEGRDKSTGFRTFFGYFKNLIINVIENYRIDISGSLPKCHFGTNLHTLTRGELQYAIKILSDELNIDISTAKVTYIEFGTNFFVKQNVLQYMKLMGDCNTYLRKFNGTIQSPTLYYENTVRELCFYSKIPQMKKRDRIWIPDSCIKENVLRYEIRIKRPDKEFKSKEITVSTLWNDSFYSRVLVLWEKLYFKIIKKKQLVIPEEASLKNSTDLGKYCLAYAMQNDNLREAIQRDIAKEHVEDYNRTRIKQAIRKAQMFKNLLVANPLMNELDEMVRNVVRFHQ